VEETKKKAHEMCVDTYTKKKRGRGRLSRNKRGKNEQWHPSILGWGKGKKIDCGKKSNCLS